MPGANGTGLVSLAGRGFSAAPRAKLFASGDAAPTPAANRAYLRAALPAVYQENDFSMRFVGALETLLDPIVAILDSLQAYVDPDTAPQDLLELLTAWLGLELDETQTPEQRRELIRRAAELGRTRGTRAGLELALELAFPGAPLRVEDGGGVLIVSDPASLPDVNPPHFDVYCDEQLTQERLAAIARVIERVKPVHVGHRLRVRKPKRSRTGEQTPPEESRPDEESAPDEEQP
jgi:phage tail-like protein